MIPVNGVCSDVNFADKCNNEDRSVNTFERRSTQLKSDGGVFPQTNYDVSTHDLSYLQEHIPSTKSVKVNEEIEKRHGDRTYSDLYGQTGHSDRQPKQNTVISAASTWTSKESQASTWKGDSAPNERKQHLLKSDLDHSVTPVPGTKDIDAGHRVPGQGDFTTKQQEMETSVLNNTGFYQKHSQVSKDPTSAKILDLKFDNLPQNADSSTLKKIAGVRHVIEADTTIDNIKNECTGAGKISMRLGEGDSEASIIQRFKDEGITVSKPSDVVGKVNNYKDLASTNWKDSHLQVQEKRHVQDNFGKLYARVIPIVDSKTSKVRMLESNIQIGDNEDKGKVAKAFQRSITNDKSQLSISQRYAEDVNLQVSQWKNMSSSPTKKSGGAADKRTLR